MVQPPETWRTNNNKSESKTKGRAKELEFPCKNKKITLDSLAASK